MKVILLILFIGVAAVGQTSSDFRQKYGKPKSESFQIRPNIEMTVTYGKSGKACTLLLEPSYVWIGVMKMDEDSTYLEWSAITEIFDEIMPKERRGTLQIGPRHGRVAWEYEKVRLSLNNDMNNSRRALIWMKDACQ